MTTLAPLSPTRLTDESFISTIQLVDEAIKTADKSSGNHDFLKAELHILAASIETITDEISRNHPQPINLEEIPTIAIIELLKDSSTILEEIIDLFVTANSLAENVQGSLEYEQAFEEATNETAGDLQLLNQIGKKVLDRLSTIRQAQRTNELRAKLQEKSKPGNPPSPANAAARVVEDGEPKREYQYPPGLLAGLGVKRSTSTQLNSKYPTTPLELHVRKTISDLRRGRHEGTASTIIYNVSWEVRSFLETFVDRTEFPSLGSILTVTGNGPNAYATDCLDYLTQNYPLAGVSVLSVLQDYLQNSVAFKKGGRYLNEVSQIKFIRTASVFISIQPRTEPTEFMSKKPHDGNLEHVKIVVKGFYPILVEVTMILAWVCAAFRVIPSNKAFPTSAALVQAIPDKQKGLSIHLPTTLVLDNSTKVQTTQNDCWHHLFKGSSIALDHPIPSRLHGRGLEISFNNMAMLARSLHLVEYDRGLVVEGLSTLLVPMANLEADDAFQWHLENKHRESTSGSKIRKLLAFDILRKLPRWHRELNAELLQDRRCFLGWADSVNVAVGTSTFSTSSQRSGLSECISTGRPLTFDLKGAFTSGISGTGSFGIMSGFRMGPPTAPSRQLGLNTKDIDDALYDSTQSQVIVYDNSTKIAWMIPQTYVILHLIRVVVTLRDYQILDANGKRAELPAEVEGVQWDIQQALNIIHASLTFGVKKRQCVESISEIVKMICVRLDIFASSVLSTYAQARKGFKGPPKYLFGYDLRDLARNERNPSLKEVRINKPWAQFAELDGFVLFCKDFGQAIAPTVPRSLHLELQRVPENQQYLVATGNSIRSLLERTEDNDGSRISDYVEWKVQLSHTRGAKSGTVSNHIQYLEYTKKPRRVKELMPYVNRHCEAGFIFGEAGDRLLFSQRLMSSHGPQEESENTLSKSKSSNLASSSKPPSRFPPSQAILLPNWDSRNTPRMLPDHQQNTNKSHKLNSPRLQDEITDIDQSTHFSLHSGIAHQSSSMKTSQPQKIQSAQIQIPPPQSEPAPESNMRGPTLHPSSSNGSRANATTETRGLRRVKASIRLRPADTDFT